MKNKETFIDMGYDKKLVSKIDKTRNKIIELTNQLFELQKEANLTSSKYVEEIEVVKIKTGRKKTDFIEHRVKAGYILYQEGFSDEDTGEVIMIDRRELVSINGVFCSSNAKAIKGSRALYQLEYSDKKVWDEFPLKEEKNEN